MDSLKQRYGLDSDIAVGASGDFEVSLNGSPVFSKRKLGRFPEPGEVEGLMKELVGK